MQRIPVLLMVAALAACAPQTEPPRTVYPGAPGEASRQAEAGPPRTSAAPATAADVAFIRAMIPHHAQALTMAALVPPRTERGDVRLLAERIEASQEAEIAQMRRWLESRGKAAAPAAPAGHDEHDAETAHGMATPEELAGLAAARGPAFDRLFLELMIRHHEGALRMTRDLLATEGGGQEPELFQLISHIDADQRAEIARMRRMLNAQLP